MRGIVGLKREIDFLYDVSVATAPKLNILWWIYYHTTLPFYLRQVLDGRNGSEEDDMAMYKIFNALKDMENFMI